MRIGIDLDNTLIDYGTLFHELAARRGWLPDAASPQSKTEVRDTLRGEEQGEARWRELQAMVYGTHILGARLATGARRFLTRCRELGAEVFVVSHKTEHPAANPDVNLHEAALDFLEQSGLFDGETPLIHRENVHFCATRGEKSRRMGELGLSLFIDDLPEMFADPEFPEGVLRVRYAPEEGQGESGPWDLEADFRMLAEWLPGEAAMELAAVQLFEAAPVFRSRLSGGRNGRLTLLEWADGQRAVCKLPADDGRGRFRAERAAYGFFEKAAITCVPRLLGADEERRCLFLEHVSGQTAHGKPGFCDALLDFLRALSAARQIPEARALPPASEACPAMSGHAAAVRARIARLESATIDPQAQEIVTEVRALLPGFEQRLAERCKQHGFDMHAALSSELLVPSPSDVGPHNTILAHDGRFVFHDFEFFGLDDPAKLIADTVLHPGSGAVLQDDFVQAGALALSECAEEPSTRIAQRARLVLPLAALKWTLLFLNEFLAPERMRRRQAGAVSEHLLEKQLEKARAMLARAKDLDHALDHALDTEV